MLHGQKSLNPSARAAFPCAQPPPPHVRATGASFRQTSLENTAKSGFPNKSNEELRYAGRRNRQFFIFLLVRLLAPFGTPRSFLTKEKDKE
jgi:hypothetical protein